jgi:hypothetical protein
LQNAALTLLFFGVLLAAAFMLDEGDASYGKVQSTLLVVSVAAGLLLVIMHESVGEIARSLRRALALNRPLDTHDKGLALFGVVFIVAAVAVLFVVDYGSLGTGFRIGGVVAVGLAKLARTALTSIQG